MLAFTMAAATNSGDSESRGKGLARDFCRDALAGEDFVTLFWGGGAFFLDCEEPGSESALVGKHIIRAGRINAS